MGLKEFIILILMTPGRRSIGFFFFFPVFGCCELVTGLWCITGVRLRGIKSLAVNTAG